MPSKIASLILAAGESKRFGENKSLARIGSQYLIERTLTSFLCHNHLKDEIIVVTGHYTEDLKPILKKTIVKQIHNPSFNLGMFTSIQIGLDSLRNRLKEFSGIIIHPGDIPFITKDDVERLLTCHKSFPDHIIIPEYNGIRGHPILIPYNMFQGLYNLNNESEGLRGLIRTNDNLIKYAKVENQGILEDIDLKKELDELSHLF
jgi:CTP:molybdopterin cytidylyltransferase MocA